MKEDKETERNRKIEMGKYRKRWLEERKKGRMRREIQMEKM